MDRRRLPVGIQTFRHITLDPGYSTICGYTEADLDTVFAPELPGLDRDLIRTWYPVLRSRVLSGS